MTTDGEHIVESGSPEPDGKAYRGMEDQALAEPSLTPPPGWPSTTPLKPTESARSESEPETSAVVSETDGRADPPEPSDSPEASTANESPGWDDSSSEPYVNPPHDEEGSTEGDDADSREPQPEPAGAFGWDFASAAGEAGDWAFAPPKKRRLWLVLTAAGTFLVVAVAVAFVLLAGNGNSGKAAAPTSAPPQAAGAIGPELLAAYQPQQVTRRRYEGRVQVSWLSPTRTDGIVGYLAVAQSPAGVYQGSSTVRADERMAVLSGTAVTADSCVVVVTLISAEPAMKLAPGEPVCAMDNLGPEQAAPASGPSGP